LRKVSQAAAAELMDVSLRAVQAAAVVTDKGTPEEVDRVLSGQEAVTRAEKAIRDKEKEIREAAKANPSRFGDLAAQLDKKDAKVDPIHRELKKREKADTKKADVMQDANGTTVPDHLRDVWGDPWIAQVAEALEEVARDILPKALKKVEGKGGRYRFILSSEIMKALATAIEEVKVAHGQLTKNKPHAVCPDCGGESAAKKGAGKCDSCRSGGILPEWRYREIKKGRK
jgi:Zn finger protein HypA/HybF involved in hydrogenase expression